MRGSRRRFNTFWLLALVSIPIASSRKPYHIATRWIVPSWFIVAIDIEWRPWRNSSISSCVILMTSRCFVPIGAPGWSGGDGRVDGNDGPTDVAGFVGPEERDQRRAVLGSAHGTVRHDARQERHRCTFGKLEVLGDRSVDPTGCERVGSQTRNRVLDRDGAGEQRDPTLRRGVGRAIRLALDPGDRRDVDDAPARLEQQRNARPAHEERAGQVHRDDPVPI